jgi:hypothetical protein
MHSFRVVELLFLLQRVADADAHQPGRPGQCAVRCIISHMHKTDMGDGLLRTHAGACCWKQHTSRVPHPWARPWIRALFSHSHESDAGDSLRRRRVANGVVCMAAMVSCQVLGLGIGRATRITRDACMNIHRMYCVF